MPRKKREPKYKVGDFLVDIDKSSIGVVIEVTKPMYDNYLYYTKNLDGTNSAKFQSHFTLCQSKGKLDKKLCSDCKFRFQCWTKRK